MIVTLAQINLIIFKIEKKSFTMNEGKNSDSKCDPEWYNYTNLLPKLKKITDKDVDSFLEKWEDSIWNEYVRSKTEQCSNIQDLKHISICVPRWVMDHLKAAIDLFVKGNYRASIALIGYIRENFKGEKSRPRQKPKIDRCSGEAIKTRKMNEQIRIVRNYYIHSEDIKKISKEDRKYITGKIREDCLKILNLLIEWLNIHYPHCPEKQNNSLPSEGLVNQTDFRYSEYEVMPDFYGSAIAGNFGKKGTPKSPFLPSQEET